MISWLLATIASPVRYRSGVVKILLCWSRNFGMAQKITSSVRYRSGGTDSGTLFP
ncbi:hypothetical protein [Flavobacterium sp. CECT 9288]|uniref:hypothetical protein n=1 Tax=Flavobacterium sp. CECT 9288 TaxID=2845819 RepID=UPI001E3898AE|nr:hypothetical protein [Flavobacterium sp. CECT 9288]